MERCLTFGCRPNPGRLCLNQLLTARVRTRYSRTAVRKTSERRRRRSCSFGTNLHQAGHIRCGRAAEHPPRRPQTILAGAGTFARDTAEAGQGGSGPVERTGFRDRDRHHDRRRDRRPGRRRQGNLLLPLRKEGAGPPRDGLVDSQGAVRGRAPRTGQRSLARHGPRRIDVEARPAHREGPARRGRPHDPGVPPRAGVRAPARSGAFRVPAGVLGRVHPRPGCWRAAE